MAIACDCKEPHIMWATDIETGEITSVSDCLLCNGRLMNRYKLAEKAIEKLKDNNKGE